MCSQISIREHPSYRGQNDDIRRPGKSFKMSQRMIKMHHDYIHKEQSNFDEFLLLISSESISLHLLKINSMVWVRERTIPTERPPLVGEVIANVCWYRVPRGQRNGSLRPYSRFSSQEPLLFYQVAPQLYSRGWVDPVHYISHARDKWWNL
jgi:hypothetical protein